MLQKFLQKLQKTQNTGRIISDSKFLIGKVVYKDYIQRFKFFNKKIKKGEILEIKCGQGNGTEILSSDNNLNIIALDDNRLIIKNTKKKLGHKKNVKLICADTFSFLKKNTKKFDYIICDNVFEHIKYCPFLIHLIKKNLYPNGLLIAITQNATVLKKLMGSKHYMHEREFTTKEMNDLLSKEFRTKPQIYIQTYFYKKPKLLADITFLYSFFIKKDRGVIKKRKNLAGVYNIYLVMKK